MKTPDTKTTQEKQRIELESVMDSMENPISKKLNKVSSSKILRQIIEEAGQIDFKSLVHNDINIWRKELEVLKPLVKNADGTANTNNKAELARYDALENKISGCRVTKNHYIIHCIERLQAMANDSNWAFSKRSGSIYLFNGEHWMEIEKEEFFHFLGDLGVKMGIPALNAKHFAFRDDLLKQFMATYFLEKSESEGNKVVINLSNGAFEISPKAQKLREFRKDDFLKYKLSFEYNKKAKAPLFQKYLDRVLPSKEIQRVFFETIGYVFTKNSDCKLECMTIFYGQGANGKSVALELIQALIGHNNVSNYGLSSLTDRTGYSRAQIGDKLVNIASEISGSLESEFFKQLSSGESVEARRPYGEPFVLNDYSRFMFACNVLPKNVEQTDGFFRRFKIIPFDVQIPKSERNIDLTNQIIEAGELSGVFNLVLDGLKRILRQRAFSPCEEIDNIGNKYKKESNSALMFLEEKGFERSNTEYTSIAELFKSYKRYCMDAGNSPFTKLNFQKTLKNNGFDVKRQNVGMVAYIVPRKVDLHDDF